MKIITISGASSGVGKTTVAENLLHELKGWSALKITVSHNGMCPANRDCGACENLDANFSVISDKNIIEEKGKDTERLKNAGASQVLWLKCKPEGLRQGIKEALSKMKRAKGVIVEGTSVLRYLKPDLSIFVKKDNSRLKSSASKILKKVDIVLTT